MVASPTKWDEGLLLQAVKLALLNLWISKVEW